MTKTEMSTVTGIDRATIDRNLNEGKKLKMVFEFILSFSVFDYKTRIDNIAKFKGKDFIYGDTTKDMG